MIVMLILFIIRLQSKGLEIQEMWMKKKQYLIILIKLWLSKIQMNYHFGNVLKFCIPYWFVLQYDIQNLLIFTIHCNIYWLKT